jgi:hypothetical protein
MGNQKSLIEEGQTMQWPQDTKGVIRNFRPRFTTSDYSFDILWPLYCLPFLDLRLLIIPVVS